MPEPPPAGYVAHRANGRVRLRFPALRGNAARVTQIAEHLRGVNDVIAVTATPLTGSVLVHHRGDWTAIASRCTGIADLSRAAHGPPRGAAAVPAAASIGLGALAIVQLLRGQVLPPAVTLLWYAGTLVAALNREPN